MSYEFEFYHGVALCRLIHDGRASSVKLYSSDSNSGYILNNEIGMYVKYSTKRMTPWQFTFTKVQRDEIFEMMKKLGKVSLILVCHDDGIVCLNAAEINMILSNSVEGMQSISVGRGPREKYSVSGKDGKLNYKFGDNLFPSKIFNI